jgi:hypothetical protein
MRSNAQENYTSARVPVSELSATIADLGDYDNKARCHLFNCAREFSSGLCGDPQNFDEEF